MAENEASLSDLFKSARSSQDDLDAIDPRTEDFKRLLQSTISTLKQCQILIDRLALFSTNEELDDVSTNDIQYLGTDYLLAEVTMKGYDPEDRRSQLNSASELLEKFLTRMDEYQILSIADTKLFQAFKDDRQNFRIIRDSAGLEAKRNVKIKRFQEEKQLKSRLELLREQSQSHLLNVDDETTRNLYLAELALFVHQAFASLDLISQERAILASIPATANGVSSPKHNDSRDRDRNGNTRHEATDRTGYSDRLDPLVDSTSRCAILDSQGRPLQPFTLTAKRTDLQKGVFRSGHNLPTMSIDEYLEEEKKRGGIIEGTGDAEPRAPDEDDMRAVDEATMKARQWDEYVEANPKGSGNTLNRG